MKKYILSIFVIALALACTNPGVSSSEGDLGKKIFDKNCKLCHGADGKQMLNGAKDLNLSTMTLKERINIITNGKKVMIPFKDVLTKDEIKAVAEYTKETFNAGK